MKKLTLDELRDCEVGCLKEIHRFCEAHGLQYFLAFGTLIGAVRHKGFIPWDDDIDILMPRKDYNYLLQNFRADNYKLIFYEIEPQYNHAYAKVIDTRTVLKEKYVDLVIGAFVDIFPLDALPNKRINRFLFGSFVRWKRLSYHLAGLDLNKKRPFHKILMIRLAKLLYKGKNTKELQYTWKYPQKYINRENTLYYGLLYRVFPGIPVLDAKWFAEQILLEFEYNLFYAPCGYDAFLRYCYGDYLQLPAVEEQKTHHAFTCWWNENVQEEK